MKKLLAMTLSIIMMCGVLSSCGKDDANDDSKSNKTTTTTAATTTAPEATTPAATTTEAPAADGPKAIDEISDTLVSMDKCSVKWTMDTKVDEIVEPFAEKDYANDESHVNLTMEELDGIPMIKVEVLDKTDNGANYKIPKIRFDMSKLFEGNTAVLPDIFTIKMDVVTKAVGKFKDADTGEETLVPGNFMGAFVTQPIKDDGNQDWQQLVDVGESEWTSEWAAYEISMRPGIKPAAVFKDSAASQYVSFMRWGIPNQADFYIANITFLDKDNNVIPCNYGK